MMPLFCGVKVTSKVQRPLPLRVVPQGVEPPGATEKSALADQPRVRLLLVLLVKVTLCPGLVVPTVWLANERLLVIESPTTPLPVRLATCGAPTAVSLMVNAPGTVAMTVGLK